MSNPVMPSNSTEFEVLTTRPVWSDVLARWNIFNQDVRLGNISPRVHDIHYIWDRFELADHICSLRDGMFSDASKSVLVVAIAQLETSQSILGFLRKNARSVHQESNTHFSEGGKRGFNPFGGGKK